MLYSYRSQEFGEESLISGKRQKLLLLGAALSAFVFVCALISSIFNTKEHFLLNDNILKNDHQDLIPYLVGENRALESVFTQEARKSKLVQKLYVLARQHLISDLENKIQVAVDNEVEKERRSDFGADYRSVIPTVIDLAEHDRSKLINKAQLAVVLKSIRKEIRDDISSLQAVKDDEVRRILKSKRIDLNVKRSLAKRDIKILTNSSHAMEGIAHNAVFNQTDMVRIGVGAKGMASHFAAKTQLAIRPELSSSARSFSSERRPTLLATKTEQSNAAIAASNISALFEIPLNHRYGSGLKVGDLDAFRNSAGTVSAEVDSVDGQSKAASMLFSGSDSWAQDSRTGRTASNISALFEMPLHGLRDRESQSGTSEPGERHTTGAAGVSAAGRRVTRGPASASNISALFQIPIASESDSSFADGALSAPNLDAGSSELSNADTVASHRSAPPLHIDFGVVEGNGTHGSARPDGSSALRRPPPSAAPLPPPHRFGGGLRAGAASNHGVPGSDSDGPAGSHVDPTVPASNKVASAPNAPLSAYGKDQPASRTPETASDFPSEATPQLNSESVWLPSPSQIRSPSRQIQFTAPVEHAAKVVQYDRKTQDGLFRYAAGSLRPVGKKAASYFSNKDAEEAVEAVATPILLPLVLKGDQGERL